MATNEGGCAARHPSWTVDFFFALIDDALRDQRVK